MQHFQKNHIFTNGRKNRKSLIARQPLILRIFNATFSEKSYFYEWSKKRKIAHNSVTVGPTNFKATFGPKGRQNSILRLH